MPPRWAVYGDEDELRRGMQWAVENGYNPLLLLRVRYVAKLGRRVSRRETHADAIAELDRCERDWRTG